MDILKRGQLFVHIICISREKVTAIFFNFNCLFLAIKFNFKLKKNID